MPHFHPFTESEKRALFRALGNFKPCTCSAQGSLYERICAVHLFTAETDRQVSRLDHLLYVRRTRDRWLNGEMMGQPWPAYEQEPDPGPALNPEPSKTAQPDDPNRLPW